MRYLLLVLALSYGTLLAQSKKAEQLLPNVVAVAAALADRPEDWPFSSYGELVGESETLIPREKILDWFGGKDSFVDFHRDFQAYRDTDPDF